MHWRRKWQPTPVFFPGESQGRLVGCRLWGRTELDMTERLDFHFSLSCIGEGNGNPLQCSSLENPRDVWLAAVYGDKWDFPDGTVVKNPPASAGDAGSNPWVRKTPGEGDSTALQYSCLENSMDGGAWWAAVPGVTQSDTTEHHHHTELRRCLYQGQTGETQRDV